MEICTESAAAAQNVSNSLALHYAAEYSGAWIGGAHRRVPAKEPLGLGAQRHLSLYPAAAAQTHTVAQAAGGDEAMDGCTDDESSHEAMSMMVAEQGALVLLYYVAQHLSRHR